MSNKFKKNLFLENIILGQWSPKKNIKANSIINFRHLGSRLDSAAKNNIAINFFNLIISLICQDIAPYYRR